jgi:DNA polymerase (family 10)
VDILEDGRLDLPDSILGDLDLVVAAVHTQLDMSRNKQTTRILKVTDSPCFSILAHPSGQRINQREPMDLDILRIVRHARERDCFLEINTQPERLNLVDMHARMAKKEGILLAVNSDAYSIHDFAHLPLGIP